MGQARCGLRPRGASSDFYGYLSGGIAAGVGGQYVRISLGKEKGRQAGILFQTGIEHVVAWCKVGCCRPNPTPSHPTKTSVKGGVSYHRPVGDGGLVVI